MVFMRYIGSKQLLLKNIEQVIYENVKDDCWIFCDIFSWTWTVGFHFKNHYKIISNDLLYFSYVIQQAKIWINVMPSFSWLDKIWVKDPLRYLNNNLELVENWFIHQNYSPWWSEWRMYFTEENAIRIDSIRLLIDKWKQDDCINQREYFYLLASLIEAIPFISNIAWTYWAYLKHRDKRALNPLDLKSFVITNNNQDNICYNWNSSEIIKKLNWDILYIDPPYNSRQYVPNYHVLETIACYDNPEIYWKTGMRPYTDKKSKFCSKVNVLSEFDDLIKNANFKHIIVSYSSEWILSEHQIKDVLCNYGNKDSYRLYRIPYRRYKHTKWENTKSLEEFMFYIWK